MTKRDCNASLSLNQVKKIRVTDTASFIKNSNIVHGGLYDYSQSVYTKSRDKIKIICRIHGLFKQSPMSHNSGKGCPKCGVESSSKTRSLPMADFINRASNVHKDKYDYRLSVVKTSKSKVIIICPEHGCFKQEVTTHLMGKGCPKCGNSRSNVDRIPNNEDFIKNCRKEHGDTYEYNKVRYCRSQEKIVITCRTHGDFTQQANSHLRGSGCPKCAKIFLGYGRNTFKRVCDKNNNGSGIFYVLKCFLKQETFYKVGLTSRSVSERYHNKLAMPYEYSEEFLIEGSSDFIYSFEKKTQMLLKKFSYQPSIKFNGMTECFSTIKPIEKLLKEIQSTDQLQLLA